MKNRIVFAIATAALAAGCVQTRPSRNGVFNENQYVRKDFLVRDGAGTEPDNGWWMMASFVGVSSPNLLGGFGIDVEPGINSTAQIVRFEITEDHLNLLNQREITDQANPYRVPEVVNAWPVTNVDLKYQINLDGETTNFYQENQELDWQVRQWVKVKFAKNDMSDVAPMGPGLNSILEECGDLGNSSTTLVPGSFNVDTANDYMEWTVEITVPLNFTDTTCLQSYGAFLENAIRLGKTNATFDLKYSFMRALPMSQVTYQPLQVAEKDPIRHKYAFLEFSDTTARDPVTGLVASRQFVNRLDPQKSHTYYFARGFPTMYMDIFTGPGGVMDQTNQLMMDSGVPMRVAFKNFDEDLDPGQAPREYGDIRYNFLLWQPDLDTDEFWGLTIPSPDWRTGEIINNSIVFSEETFIPTRDWFVQRIDSYLVSIGASDGINSDMPWPDLGACKDGDVVKVVPDTLINNHDGNDSLYQKMQQYLQKPSNVFGPLGPQDFVPDQDTDFYNAYYTLLPYYIFADPASNQFVTPEGTDGVYGPTTSFTGDLAMEYNFQSLASAVNWGQEPYVAVTGTQGVINATGFLNNFRQSTQDHAAYTYRSRMSQRQKFVFRDDMSSFSFEAVIANAARHCINGAWQTKEQWADDLIRTFWSQVFWHEFGHSLGLDHNFMGSLDRRNFPTYMDGAGRTQTAMFSNSVMEYGAPPADVLFHPGWGPYDQGAISWIYANSAPTAIPPLTACKVNTDCLPTETCATTGMCAVASITGQATATAPWKDPHGFQADGKTENVYLMCRDWDSLYTPFCQPYDIGTRPSEIIANAIDEYEWQYQWTNFRNYRKFWNDSAYANGPTRLITDLRKFLSLWAFDWSPAELADTFRRIGVVNPNPNGSAQEYYQQLTNKFNKEISTANQLVAVFHKAIIQESSGERPYATIYDKFYGDVTQQGIILDKLLAMQGWVALWPTTNYDPNQAGSYIASYSSIDNDASYQYVAEDAVSSMIGGQYDVYPYFVPLAVAQFAQDTHSPSFNGRIEVRDWIGGQVFSRLQDFLDYFRNIAVQNALPGCTTIENCAYDPRPLGDNHNEFTGPDSRIWIWAFIPDRNQYVAIEKERNIASYVIIRNYNDYIVSQLDDGAFPGGAYSAELPLKFFLDSFNMYN